MVSHNILLVDNELLSRDLLSNHLKHDGYKVFTADSCAEAKKLISRNRFRLAIINNRLGEKGTAELVSRLHTFEKDVLVHLLVPQLTAGDAENLARKGIHDTIIKPFRLDEIKIKLRHSVEILTLRGAVRKLTERLRKLEQQLESYQSVEEQIKIPDLSRLEVQREDSVESGSEKREDGPGSIATSKEEPQAASLHEQKAARETDAIEQIRRLDDLRKSGILTQSEFDIKKRELLKRI
ncbi:MAG TPA: response regulator [archaeon]|nr:response regulator [archaeon]